MQGTVPIAFGSQPAPEGNVEPNQQQVAESPVDGSATAPQETLGQVEQTETTPVESTTQTPANEYEQRYKDTQRALAAREIEIAKRDAQIELLKNLSTARSQPAPEPVKPVDLVALRQEVDLTPSKMVDIIQERDRYFQDQFARQAMYFEDKLAQLDPDYAELQPALRAIEDMPEAQYLSPAAKKELVKRIQSSTSGQRATMSPNGGAPGQRRFVQPPAQPVSNEQRFAAHLRASGAVRDTVKPGTIPWTSTREK